MKKKMIENARKFLSNTKMDGILFFKEVPITKFSKIELIKILYLQFQIEIQLHKG